jgi:hypothetical protein
LVYFIKTTRRYISEARSSHSLLWEPEISIVSLRIQLL